MPLTSSRVVHGATPWPLPPSAQMLGLSWVRVAGPLMAATAIIVALGAAVVVAAESAGARALGAAYVVALGGFVVVNATRRAVRPVVAFQGPLVWVHRDAGWSGPVDLGRAATLETVADGVSPAASGAVLVRTDDADEVVVPLFAAAVVDHLRAHLPGHVLAVAELPPT